MSEAERAFYEPVRRCVCRHMFDAHGPSGCHATMTITPVKPEESGRVRCKCKRWPPVDGPASPRDGGPDVPDPDPDWAYGSDGKPAEYVGQPSLVELDAYGSTREEREFQRSMEAANDRSARCADPHCDGEFGHDGPHFAWVPE